MQYITKSVPQGAYDLNVEKIARIRKLCMGFLSIATILPITTYTLQILSNIHYYSSEGKWFYLKQAVHLHKRQQFTVVAQVISSNSLPYISWLLVQTAAPLSSRRKQRSCCSFGNRNCPTT